MTSPSAPDKTSAQPPLLFQEGKQFKPDLQFRPISRRGGRTNITPYNPLPGGHMRLLLLVAILFVAMFGFAQTRRPDVRFTNPPTLSTPTGYTHVVEVNRGRTVYIAGQIAFDKSGNIVGAGDFKAQTRQVFENLKAALAVAGA